jgi:16S rRNA (cytosine967-C5)-methyltransferase
MDAVLRAELRRQTGFSRQLSTAVARTVFAWQRWRGWLDEDRPIAELIPDAMSLQRRFISDPESFSDDELLLRAVPAWTADLVKVTPEWVRALQREPTLWLRARLGTGGDLAAILGECRIPEHPSLVDAVKYLGQEDLFKSPEFHAGDFEVQDLSSQIVGLLCNPQPGETWWDVCAGEGGKLLHLSDLMRNQGLIWASDRAEWRLKRLKLRAARAKAFNYRAALWDGGTKLPTKTKFNGVLIDAPCSGVGTWQRNPHARWTMTPEDVYELAAVQKRLLAQVAPSLKTGGKLIYSVCTLTRAETIETVESFEKQFADFTPLKMQNPLKPETAATHGVWLWPTDGGGNGMFVAAWSRK